MDCIQDQPQDVSSLLQDTAAQIESVSTMEARHAAEITALFSRQSTEAAELQARQAQEKVVSLSRVLEMHRQLVAKVKLELNNVREDRESLAAEVAQMSSADVADGDILELNIAGKYMSTTRETLTQAEDSLLAKMFGPRWAGRQKLDNQGRIFLNYDPYCFEQLLSFLMSKLIEHPEQPTPLPVIKAEAQAKFAQLVGYLGVKEFLEGTGRPDAAGSAALHVMVDFTFTKTLGMAISQDGHRADAAGLGGQENVSFASPAMHDGSVQYIKCSIVSCKAREWLFLGITQLSEPEKDAEREATSWGWSTLSEFAQGESMSEYVPAWQQGDEAIFKIDLTSGERVLFMWCRRLFRINIRNVAKAPFYFHFGAANKASTVSVSLCATTAADRQHFG